MEVRPIKKGKVINKINFKTIIECSKEIFGQITECKTYNSLTICEEKNIKNITVDSFIPQLIKSKKANCTKINNDDVKDIEEIFDDLILLNNFKGQIKINNENVTLDGSYLIKHNNENITIRNKDYWSKSITSSKPLPAAFQIVNEKNDLEEIISLQMLKNLNYNNTKHIEIINETNKLYLSINIIVIISIICIIVIVIKKIKNKHKLNLQNKEKVKVINLENITQHLSSLNEDVQS